MKVLCFESEQLKKKASFFLGEKKNQTKKTTCLSPTVPQMKNPTVSKHMHCFASVLFTVRDTAKYTLLNNVRLNWSECKAGYRS